MALEPAGSGTCPLTTLPATSAVSQQLPSNSEQKLGRQMVALEKGWGLLSAMVLLWLTVSPKAPCVEVQSCGEVLRGWELNFPVGVEARPSAGDEGLEEVARVEPWR